MDKNNHEWTARTDRPLAAAGATVIGGDARSAIILPICVHLCSFVD
jgi:hypothetical protein